jgi:hypothetical protein
MAIQGDEAGAATEDAVKPRAQCEPASFAWIGSVDLEVGVELPDQVAHVLLSGTLLIAEEVDTVSVVLGDIERGKRTVHTIE